MVMRSTDIRNQRWSDILDIDWIQQIFRTLDLVATDEHRMWMYVDRWTHGLYYADIYMDTYMYIYANPSTTLAQGADIYWD